MTNSLICNKEKKKKTLHGIGVKNGPLDKELVIGLDLIKKDITREYRMVRKVNIT